MQSVTFEHLNRQNAAPLKTRNQIEHRRRDSTRHRTILSAVREWEATIPGQSQDVVTQLVADAIKECGEHHQAKLLGMPTKKQAKEGFENLLANAALLPGELAGVVIAHLQALAPLFT